jgi:hypothetical protein
MNYEITIKCVNEPSFSEKLAKGIKRSVGAQSFYHAICSVVEELAEDVLKEEYPREVWLEVSALSNEGACQSFAYCIEYEEGGIPPYRYGERPDKDERAVLKGLSEAFPSYEFKYYKKRYSCRLNSIDVDIGEYISKHSNDKDEPMIIKGLGADNEALKRAYRKQQIFILHLANIRDGFFKPQGIDLEIEAIPKIDLNILDEEAI